jgi:hypothetical protein
MVQLKKFQNIKNIENLINIIKKKFRNKKEM